MGVAFFLDWQMHRMAEFGPSIKLKTLENTHCLAMLQGVR